MKRLPQLPIPVLVLALGAIGACEAESPTSPESTGKQQEVQAPRAGGRSESAQLENKDCWWYEIGKSRLVAVWVSPRLEGQVPGGFRFVNLYFHDPDQKAPFSLHSSPVPNREGKPVALRSGARAFAAVPRDGKSWGQVRTRADLSVRCEVF